MDSGLLSDDSFDMAIDDDPPISFLRTSASEFPLGHEIDWTSHHNLSSDIVVQLDKYTIPEPVSARSPEYLAIETNLSPQNDVTSPLVAPKETVSPEETLSPLSPSPGAITPSSSTYYPSPLSDVQMTLPDFQEEEETELEATGKISVLAAPSAALVPEPSDASYRLTGTSEPVEESIAERVLASPNKRRRVNAPVARPRSSSILSLPPSDANKRRRLESPAARSRSSSVLSSPPSEGTFCFTSVLIRSQAPILRCQSRLQIRIQIQISDCSTPPQRPDWRQAAPSLWRLAPSDPA
ncbi:hypothetical protein C8R46DRAFT_45991 [Mycena filopes]|nr:hypothetical protein C8R46DRAFT_45991 [Mycena filopes]